tara:strand:- start:100 stop:861 length:762 start_codon:yes stop_codon:yes gene_type:complete
VTNLIIGNTSQLAQYMPTDFDRVSSRNINVSEIKDYNKIYVCFAEQRTFDNDLDFDKINYDYTLSLFDELTAKCDKIIFYSTAMLWENLEQYGISDEFSYNEENKYLKSKERITKELKKRKNVILHYPCNFNSTKRKGGYLFHKLMSACIGEKIQTGNLDFNREMVHTKYIAQRSLNSEQSEIIAPGFLINLFNFFGDVLNHFGVRENWSSVYMENKEKKHDSRHKNIDSKYDYDNLLNDVIFDIENYRRSVL